jgi:hypothetical protein
MIHLRYKNLNLNTKLIYLYKKDLKIGTSTISVSNDFITINNIHVHNKFRNYGFGSFMLKKIENLSINTYNVNKINLLAWQPYGSTNVIDFFKKNNYIIENNDIQLYDDYINIYELYKFEKYM